MFYGMFYGSCPSRQTTSLLRRCGGHEWPPSRSPSLFPLASPELVATASTRAIPLPYPVGGKRIGPIIGEALTHLTPEHPGSAVGGAWGSGRRSEGFPLRVPLWGVTSAITMPLSSSSSSSFHHLLSYPTSCCQRKLFNRVLLGREDGHLAIDPGPPLERVEHHTLGQRRS